MRESKCFSCGKPFKNQTYQYSAKTGDGQVVAVGPECLKKIRAAEGSGYQPEKGGPKLYLTAERAWLDEAQEHS